MGAILSGWLGKVSGVYGDETPAFGWVLLYSAGLTVPLAFRRRFPCTTLFAIAIAFFIGGSFHIPEIYVGNIALFIGMYTVGAWVNDRRRATMARLGVVAGMFLWLTVVTFQEAVSTDDAGLSQAGPFSPFAAYMLMQFLVNAAFFGGAYYFGERAYASAIARDALETRTRELERERELTAAQAVALDRVRIARELHDVVAHHVSAMGVQAGAARTILERDPDAARAVLTGIEQSARDGLAELRQLLETLRSPDLGDIDGVGHTASTDTHGASTLGLHALPDLVEHARDNGLPTTLTIVGDAIPASALVQVNLYRIAQEALTNVRRHAGPGATADVRLRYEADAIELEIGNTGRARFGAASGLGLVGMRERAAASGATIDLGPRDRGGFLVRVRVPIASPAARTPAGTAAVLS